MKEKIFSANHQNLFDDESTFLGHEVLILKKMKYYLFKRQISRSVMFCSCRNATFYILYIERYIDLHFSVITKYNL